MPLKANETSTSVPAVHSANEDDDVYLSNKSQANDEPTSVAAMVREVMEECPAAHMVELDAITTIMTVYPPIVLKFKVMDPKLLWKMWQGGSSKEEEDRNAHSEKEGHEFFLQ